MKSVEKGTSMKIKKNTSWLIFGLLALMFVVAHTVLPQTSPPCNLGCSEVYVDDLMAPSNCVASVSATVTEGPCGGVDVCAGGGLQACPYGSVGCPTVTCSGGGSALRVDTITNWCTNSGDGYFDFSSAYTEYSITVVDPTKLPAEVTITSTGQSPTWVGTNCGTPVTITASKTFKFDPNGSCSSSSCSASPNTSTSFSTGNANVGSLDFMLTLGQATPHLSAGYLRIQAETPSTALSQPSSLTAPFPETNVVVITNLSGVIQQILVPAGLVNVAVINNYEYELQCFYNTNVGSLGGNGLYTTNGPAFATWVIENPDGASADNRLWIIDERDGLNRYFEYTYSTANNEWDLLEPDGSTVVSTWQVANPTNSAITNIYRQTTYNGTVVQASQQIWKYVPGLSCLLLLQQIDGAGTTTNITTYTYYPSNSGDGSSNKLQRVDYPNGNWEYNTYDSYGRTTTNYSAFENYSPPAAGTAPNPSVNPCKVTSYFYDLDYTDDQAILTPETIQGDPLFPPRKTIISLPVQSGSSWQLHEVSRSYSFTPQDNVYLGAAYFWATQIQQCVAPGGFYYDPNNLVTTTEVINSSDWSDRLPTAVYQSDGTVLNFNYPNEEETDENNNSYILSTNLVDAWGNRLLYATADYQTGVILSKYTYIYTNSDGTYFDPLRRTHNVNDLAGRMTQYVYSDCCGLSSLADPDGVLTDYTYDILKRQIASTLYRGGPNGITSTNILDPFGHTLITQRIGTDGSVTTLAQSQYDILGRVARQTNAFEGVTSTSNVLSGGQQYVTNTYADGGTQVEQYYRDGRLESVTGTAVRGVQYQYGAEQDSETGNWVAYTLETKLDTNGSPTSEWTKIYTDSANRQYKTIYAAAGPPYPYSESYFNQNGQLWKQVDPDTNITFYTYNSNGEREFTITALSAAAAGITDYNTLLASLTTLEQNGIDRISRNERVVVPAANDQPDLVEYDNYVWTNSETDANGTFISRLQTATTTLEDWNITYPDVNTPVTNFTIIIPGVSRTNTTVGLDGSFTTSVYSYGQLGSTIRYNSRTNQITGKTYTYDVDGRPYQVTDARNGTTTYGYTNADLVSSVTTPSPGNGQSAETTTTYYNRVLEATNVLQPDGTSIYNVYLLTGDLALRYGSRTYPSAYGYDYVGRMKTMTNWSNFAGNSGARVTTWNYDSYRGFLTNKLYAGTNGPSYTYTPAGRLASRLWARNITTMYAYDAAGDMTNVSYNDSVTPTVAYEFDRQARQSRIVVNGMTNTLSYNLAGQVLSESYSGGALNGLCVSNVYDQFTRRTNLSALSSGSQLLSATYGYDNASRLISVADGNGNSATNSYAINSSLVDQLVFLNNGSIRMTTTKQYDFLNRLTQISSQPSASYMLPLSYNYSYNSVNQRIQDTLADGSYWAYDYDSLGQMTNGVKYFSTGTPVAGQQFEYTFDSIGNRTQMQSGGDQNGQGLRVANYYPNNLNQLTNRDVPPYVDIMGATTVSNIVTVAGQTAYRNQEYFRQQVSVSNSVSAAWTNIVVTGSQNVSGNLYVAQEPETFYYDADGNLTNDGRFVYVWDAENRMIQMTVNTNVGPQYQMYFAYDYRGRRIQKLVMTNSVAIYTNRFLYDGWDLVALLNPNNALQQSYLWGMDLSGSIQGAGGVGGLLEVSYSGSSTTNCFVAYDGSGNIGRLANGADGTIIGNYEYGPFGEVIRASGPSAKFNPFRFSTKYQDNESDLIYYGYRYYSVGMGKWMSADPLYESGSDARRSGSGPRSTVLLGDEAFGADFFNLYLFVRNAPSLNVDPIGTGILCVCNPPLMPLPLSAPLCGTLWGPPLYAPFGATITVGPLAGTCSLRSWIPGPAVKYCPTCAMTTPPCTFTKTYTCTPNGPGAVIGKWIPGKPVQTGNCWP